MKEICGAKCPNVRGGPDFICGRPAKHSGKHDDPNGPTWTDLGAERVKTEIAKKARRAEIEKESF